MVEDFEVPHLLQVKIDSCSITCQKNNVRFLDTLERQPAYSSFGLLNNGRSVLTDQADRNPCMSPRSKDFSRAMLLVRILLFSWLPRSSSSSELRLPVSPLESRNSSSDFARRFLPHDEWTYGGEF